MSFYYYFYLIMIYYYLFIKEYTFYRWIYLKLSCKIVNKYHRKRLEKCIFRGVKFRMNIYKFYFLLLYFIINKYHLNILFLFICDYNLIHYIVLSDCIDYIHTINNLSKDCVNTIKVWLWTMCYEKLTSTSVFTSMCH